MPFCFKTCVSVAKMYQLAFTKAGNTLPVLQYFKKNYIKRNAYFICWKFEIFVGK